MFCISVMANRRGYARLLLTGALVGYVVLIKNKAFQAITVGLSTDVN